ncbi:hypothetical protein TPSea814_000224 [Treponema pallidum subsp. pallidum str. Sea 81-4]|uniref:Uncharacterized protein TP_0224 n=2 Tax=Treponema pallidum subsp. pallidum TaxID=161 RepID=Y224_TREPA|nr:RecName: Full=Uncharacterized protein TP_0224 [Treponema pallidum subsp. pallidum str. Nichols]AAC65218.1 predicted coding region TP0224 [Treponema pallidum subsp. pallidum str. Nichols]ACD70650.1 hypothetical protein TPASS_0224 [Treponema pallidum subsp. pallidum SS14]AHN66924.1 hypothetical protein TPSea814_000224 [Treponema pallidum subsp. pallidum str. Sea 81-4]
MRISAGVLNFLKVDLFKGVRHACAPLVWDAYPLK